MERAMGFEPTTPTLARLRSISRPVGLRPDGKSGRYAACGASGSADSEVKADLTTRVASQSVYTTLRSSLRG
jgi:hypothetical protein